MLEPTDIDETREAIAGCEAVIAVGAGSKPVLSAVDERYQRLSLAKLSGVTEYDPSEFTVTVLAGTPLAELQRVLAEQGQYLPFDPPLADAGATIGGTVASGLSGPGAFRWGPIRDFLIGIRYVDGDGRLITGGGKVVKNAAGFDLPKFLVGSLGRFGVIVELTFKVFPKPEATLTFGLGPRNADHAAEMLAELSRGPYDLDALDFLPAEGVVWGRVAGRRDAVESRLRHIGEKVFPGCGIAVCEPAEADYFWRRQLDFDWATADRYLVKVPLALGQMPQLNLYCHTRLVTRSFSSGGNVAWLSPATLDPVEALDDLGFEALVIRAPEGMEVPDFPLMGAAGNRASQLPWSLKKALDPGGKFPHLQAPGNARLSSAGPERRKSTTA